MIYFNFVTCSIELLYLLFKISNTKSILYNEYGIALNINTLYQNIYTYITYILYTTDNITIAVKFKKKHNLAMN